MGPAGRKKRDLILSIYLVEAECIPVEISRTLYIRYVENHVTELMDLHDYKYTLNNLEQVRESNPGIPFRKT